MPALLLLSLAMVVLPTTPMVAVALSTDLPRASLAMAMDIMAMAMARGLLRLAMDMELLLSMCPRLTMDMATTLHTTPMDITLDMDTARGPLMLNQDITVMLSAILTEAHKDFTVTMVDTDMVVTDMVDFTARGPLNQDIMAVPALTSTRAVLTTMDLMAMVSTTMARGLLMLDISAMAMDMDMDMQAASSK